jgi:transposase InsO family protein
VISPTVRKRSGWHYLVAVLDWFARKAVGWAMAPGMLICQALHLVIVQRRSGLLGSMSRKGSCRDKAVWAALAC